MLDIWLGDKSDVPQQRRTEPADTLPPHHRCRYLMGIGRDYLEISIQRGHEPLYPCPVQGKLLLASHIRLSASL